MKWLKNLFKRKPAEPEVRSDFLKYGDMLVEAYKSGALKVEKHVDFSFDFARTSTRSIKNLRNFAQVRARLNGIGLIIFRQNRVRVMHVDAPEISEYCAGTVVDAYTEEVFGLIFDQWLEETRAMERVAREKEDAAKREIMENLLGVKK